MLVAHPDAPPAARIGVEAAILVQSNGVWLAEYIVTGEVDSLRLPREAAPERTDGLWRTTCFELFVRDPHGDGYDEFNFSPSRQWAAYAFDSYRAGMRDRLLSGHVEMQWVSRRSACALRATFDASCGKRLGLSAVIEELNGIKSYWALAHPPGKPDFHHPDCFAIELPAATAS